MLQCIRMRNDRGAQFMQPRIAVGVIPVVMSVNDE